MFKDKSVTLRNLANLAEEFCKEKFKNETPWVTERGLRSFAKEQPFENMTCYTISSLRFVDFLKIYHKRFVCSYEAFKELESICVDSRKSQLSLYTYERKDDGDFIVDFAIVKCSPKFLDWLPCKGFNPNNTPKNQFDDLKHMWFYTEQRKHLAYTD